MGDKFCTRQNMKTPYVSRDNSIILEFTKSRGVGLKPSNDRLKGIVEYKVDKNDSITEPFIAQWKEKNRVYYPFLVGNTNDENVKSSTYAKTDN